MQKKILVAAAMLFAQALFARDMPLEGTWKWNQSSTKVSGKPLVISLDKGILNCTSCVPAETVKADGQDHPIKGNAYYDTMSVTSPDAHTVKEVQKKAGKVMGENNYTVSADGKTLENNWKQTSEAGVTASGKRTLKRIAAGTTGTHMISGSWMPDKTQASDEVLIFSYKNTPNGLNYEDKTGGSYVANSDGKDYPYKGDSEIKLVSVKQLDSNTLEETFKDAGGKVILISRTAVAADGKHATITNDDKKNSRKTEFLIDKQ